MKKLLLILTAFLLTPQIADAKERCIKIRYGHQVHLICVDDDFAWMDPLHLTIPEGFDRDPNLNTEEDGRPELPKRNGPPAIRLPKRDGTPAIILPKRDSQSATIKSNRKKMPLMRGEQDDHDKRPAKRDLAPKAISPIPQRKPSKKLPYYEFKPESTEARYEKDVVRLLNKKRRSLGLNDLKVDSNAQVAARKHSADMCKRNYFSHRDPEGFSAWNRMKSTRGHFSAVGENIAMGQQNPNDVHDAWLKSVGHRKNRLNPSFRRIGVGVYLCGTRYYWTEVFLD